MSENPLSRRTLLAGGAFAAAAALGSALAGCASGEPGHGDAGGGSAAVEGTSPSEPETLLETPETNGTLAYSVSFPKGDLSPWGPDAETAACINLPVLEGLYEIDPVTQKPYPALAEGSPSKVTMNVYEIRLREYALFSDGSEVTTEDVVASFNRALKSKHGAFAKLLSVIEAIEPASDTLMTVITKVTMDELLEDRLSLMKIVPANTTEKQLSKGATGTGPWRFESVSEKSTVYVPNSFYTGTKPATAESMTCYFAPAEQERVHALSAGDVQAIEDAPADDAALKKKKSGIEIDAVPGFNPALLVFNTRREPFNDVRVRQAILEAINAKSLVKKVFGGNAKAASCFLDEGNPSYRKASRIYGGGAEKAQKLLEDAGVSDLSFVLDTGEEPWMAPAAQQIADDLAAAGISVEVHTWPIDELYGTYMDADEDEQIFAVALTSSAAGILGNDGDLLMRWFFSNDTWMEKRSGFRGSDAYDQLQKLLTTIESSKDEDQEEAWTKALDLIAEQVPLYPIVHRDKVTAWRAADVDGFEPAGTPGICMLDASVSQPSE